MSTTSPAPAEAPLVAASADPAVRTYRGRTLEELLPQIREELGPDAIVVRQRDGLMGGVGGFFQQRFVEVDAMAGRRRVDVYDEEPATPESFAQLLADAEDADPVVTAAAFAPPVADSEAPAAPPTEGGRDPNQDPPASTAVASADLATALRDVGLSPAFTERLVADAQAHELPFTQGDHRAAVRRALARRLPTALPHRAGGLAVAFAGPGSTTAADALATAYVKAGRRAHSHATLEQARTRIERAAPDAVVALDLPPLSRDADRAEVEHLACRLATIELDEILLVVPAGADADDLRARHDRLRPLALTGLALDCGDDPAAPLGAAIELACTTRLPVTYVLDRTPLGARMVPADPAALAERLLP
jgi:hypothetical protein